MNLPDFPALEPRTLEAIAARFGVAASAVSRLEEVGIFNAIFALGPDLILRVPRDHPAFTGALIKERIAVPAAIHAGLRTPQIVHFDDSLELLPVPFAVLERACGRTFGLLGLEPEVTPKVWRELGRDLARLHTLVPRAGEIAALETEALPDAPTWIEGLERDGYFGPSEARWLTDWLGTLERLGGRVAPRFVHGDIQATNLIVSDSLEYAALLDWGACGWDDPAVDFAGVPLRAVPFMLEGYREVAPTDAGFEARILRRHLHIALFLARRGPQPGRSWAERPLGVLLETFRFLLTAPQPWPSLGSPDRMREVVR